MKGLKLKRGDVFMIPLDEDKVGYGQIVVTSYKGAFMAAFFEKMYSRNEQPPLEAVTNDKILFLGYTLDALLYHKIWQMVGNITTNLKAIKLPYYKLGTPPDRKLVDYEGRIIRKISGDLFDKLSYQKFIAPIRYDNALKAYHHLGEWKQDYDELLYDNVLKNISLVE
jgi:hypothetical protein